jgi:exodeoxyribonuclease VII large subunit
MEPTRLSDLALALEAVIDDAFGGHAIWVLAETSDIKNYPDRGYCFMTLVERDGRETRAKMEAVIWRQNHHLIREFETATGIAFARNLQLLLRVSVGYKPAYGVRLEISDIDHAYTLGNLEQEREATLRALCEKHPTLVWQENGQYVTANQLLPRPAVWQRIALIAAPGSDGWRDFRHELLNNPFGYDFVIDEFLTQVQGVGAEKAICSQLDKIRAINEADLAEPYDAVVMVRGGGSQLDFGSFDTYILGLAVAGFEVPVLAGIGHERNVSITDLLCHQSVKTPTKAAAFLIDQNQQFEINCLQLRERLLMAANERLLDSREKLVRQADRLQLSAQNYIRNQQLALHEMSLKVSYSDPARLLRRGYALLWHKGRIVRQTTDLQPGDTVQAQLSDGRANLNVTGQVNETSI